MKGMRGHGARPAGALVIGLVDERPLEVLRDAQDVLAPDELEDALEEDLEDELEPTEDDEAGEEPEDLRRSSLAISGVRPIADSAETRLAALMLEGDRHGSIALAARTLGPAIGRVCFLMLGSQSEADEAAQETFLAAYHGISSYRGEGAPRAWFHGIARRICVQRLSARLRQSRRMFLLVQPELTHHDDASALHDRAERESNLRQALDGLSSDDRELLALRYDAEQSFRDIAGALGIDEAAARKRVGRALIRLRSRLRVA